MLMLYFSGTGNSKYIAETFSRYMDAKCHSIEEQLDYDQLLASEETIAFCYPIFGSRVPRIMREFVVQHIESLKNKKLIIFCTQMMFSGDGARVFTNMFPRGDIEVIYAEHFFMPNNVNNLFFLPLASKERIAKQIKAADRKMQIVCQNITAGIVKKRGFNIISRGLGLLQGVFVPGWEKRLRVRLELTAIVLSAVYVLTSVPCKTLNAKTGKLYRKTTAPSVTVVSTNVRRKPFMYFLRRK
jgi:hypothetical protein